MNCLAGIPSCYTECGRIKQAVVGENIAPFVKVVVEGEDGTEITVGNESAPDFGHKAVIKSFQTGSSRGTGTTIEIHDEQGGNFDLFMDKVVKCISDVERQYRLWVQFGWVNSSCQGGGTIVGSPSPKMYFAINHIDANLTDGKIMFRITGTSLLEFIFEARASKPYKMKLKSAIRNLFADAEWPPNVPIVDFLRQTPDGGTEEWSFLPEHGGFEGPQSTWQTNTENKLATAMNWLERFMTDRRKGITPMWDPESPTPRLIFWENPNPKPNVQESAAACGRNIGTYIVNGGICSPVLSFHPNTRWDFASLHRAGGNNGGPMSAKNVENKGIEGLNDDCVTPKGAGDQTSITAAQSGLETHGQDNFAEESAEAMAENDVANRRYHSMEAELRLQGDPELGGAFRTVSKTVGIVVINPFHMNRYGTSDCPDWLARPPVNPVYSNKRWIIKGVDHNITEGSFVTTLQVTLPLPGVDLPKDDPFGGIGSCGYVPPTKCSC